MLTTGVAVVLGWLIAPSTTVLADQKQDSSAPSATPRYPNRYDAMWRTPPLPHYIVAMSQDDPLCDSIAKAFNDASTPKGAPPGSLYKAPMFVKWQHNPRNLLPTATVTDIDFTMADPFNESGKHSIARIQFWDVRGFSYELCEFPDANHLLTPSWKSIEDVVKDPKCKKIFDSDLYNVKVKDSGDGQQVLAPRFFPTDFNRIPRSEADRYDLRQPWALSPGSEINFIVSSPDDSELIVLRNPVTEVTLVTQFGGRVNPPKNICLLGPEVPIEIPGFHPARKKSPE